VSERWLVSGTCQCDSDGYAISLEPADEGMVDGPSLIALRCVVEPPGPGATFTTEEPVNWGGGAGDAVTRIRIDYGGESTFVDIRDAQ
jgi:hypothetical protein